MDCFALYRLVVVTIIVTLVGCADSNTPNADSEPADDIRQNNAATDIKQATDNQEKGNGLFGEQPLNVADTSTSSRHEMIEKIKQQIAEDTDAGKELPVFKDGPKQ